MRVLQVIARLNVGGTARYVGRLVSELPSVGVETRVATGHVQGDEREDSVVAHLPIARIPHLGRALNLVDDIQARRELQTIIRDFEPDVIHTHTFKAGLIGRSLPNTMPLVHTFHGHLFDDPDFSGFRSHIISGIERVLAPRADALVTVGERVANELLLRRIGKREQYSSIAPGVDPLILPDRLKARDALGLKQDDLVVTWLARVTAVKAPHRVLQLARAFPEVTFIMGGGGDLLEEMMEHATPNLRVVGWADASVIYAAADIALSTSTNEGMPVSLIEAQLAGLPVVATDVGGVSEVIANEITGFVGQPEVLEGMLRQVVDDETLRNRLGSAARTRAENLFNPKLMIARHADLYSRLVAARQQ